MLRDTRQNRYFQVVRRLPRNLLCTLRHIHMRIMCLVCAPSPPVFLNGVDVLVALVQCLLSMVSHLLEILTVELLPFGHGLDLQRAVFKLEKCVLIPNLLVPIIVYAFQLCQVFGMCTRRLFEEVEFVRYLL